MYNEGTQVSLQQWILVKCMLWSLNLRVFCTYIRIVMYVMAILHDTYSNVDVR